MKKWFLPILISISNVLCYAQIMDSTFFPHFQPHATYPIIKYGDGFADAAWNDPTLLKINNQYIMYITAAKGVLGTDKVKVYRMISSDGYSWSLSPQTPVLQPVDSTFYAGGTETPSVVYLNGQYHMYIIAYPVTSQDAYSFRIGHATSTDGLSWQMDANPVLAPDSAYSWMQSVVGEPGAVVYHDSIYLFFSGAGVQNGTNIQCIGLVKSADGATFGQPIQTAKLPADVYPTSDGWFGLSTPSALAINDTIYLFTDVAKIMGGKWTQAALHQFKSYGNSNVWYHDTVPINTMADFSWTDGNYLSEIRSIAPLMDDNGRLRIWYAGNHIGDISNANDTTYHVSVDSLGIHVDPNYWGIGTSDYTFPNSSTGIVNLRAASVPCLFPNPANDFIEIKNYTSDAFNIINSVGQLVMSNQPYSKKINISQLPSGIYYLTSKDGNFKQQFIISR